MKHSKQTVYELLCEFLPEVIIHSETQKDLELYLLAQVVMIHSLTELELCVFVQVVMMHPMTETVLELVYMCR